MIFLIPTFLKAQNSYQIREKHNGLNISLFQFYNSTLELSYQRDLMKNNALYLAFGYTYVNTHDINKSGFSGEIQYRFVNKEDYIFTYYFAPFCKYQYLEAFNPFSNYMVYPNNNPMHGIDVIGKSLITGSVLGASYLFADLVYIDTFCGLGMQFSTYDNSGIEVTQSNLDFVNYKNRPVIHAGINIGFKF